MIVDFYDIVLSLHKFWKSHGCLVVLPYDIEVGAGTFHPETVFRSLGTESWKTSYVQPCRRPSDGRYGANCNRLQKYYQYQVILKPSPANVQELYLRSLDAINIDTSLHDIRFIEDNWESPSLGASGLGWEVWCDGMEITQFTYFQQMGGFDCNPVAVEITYGIERIAMKAQDRKNIMNLRLGSGKSSIYYKDIHEVVEKQFSEYNFNYANVNVMRQDFINLELDCLYLLKRRLPLPAYDKCLKASHIFNLLDSRGSLSVAERSTFISRIRAMVSSCCKNWLNNIEKN